MANYRSGATMVRSLESVGQMAQGHLLLVASISRGEKMNLLNRIRDLLGVAPDVAASNWRAVVKSGVGVDDRIILIGIRQVHDGDKVECEDL